MSPPPPSSPWSYLRRYRFDVATGVIALLITSAVALTIPWLLGQIIDYLRGADPAADVQTLALLMIAAAAIQALARIVSRIQLFNSARNAEYDLRSALLERLLIQPPSYFRKYTTGDVMSRVTNDVQTVRAMFGPGVLNIVNTTFVFTTALVLMLLIDWRLALMSLAPYPLMVLGGRGFAARLYRASRTMQDYLGTVSATVQEDLTGIGVIKNYALERERHREFADMSEQLLHKNMELVKVRGQLLPVLSGLSSLSVVVILYMGGHAVTEGRITLGQMIQFNGYLALLVWPTLALGWMLSLFQRGMSAWGRLRTILDVEPTIADGDGPPLAEIRGDLEIRDLTIELDGRKILDKVSLQVPAGSIAAIVGRTGAGKSVLVEAIPHLLELPDGAVFLDGRDIKTLPLQQLRRAIGYAPQEAFLFSTTIEQNVLYGSQHTGGEFDAGGPSTDRALEAAGLSRDLSALPHGIQTVVGERGIALSGGQRQRVALARALAAQPAVLILDDSLSSVDPETEREILSHLSEAMSGRTAILISHRVAAIRTADQIIVLDQGKVVERGDHTSLLAAGGVYAELYREAAAEQCDEPPILPSTPPDGPHREAQQ